MIKIIESGSNRKSSYLVRNNRNKIVGVVVAESYSSAMKLASKTYTSAVNVEFSRYLDESLIKTKSVSRLVNESFIEDGVEYIHKTVLKQKTVDGEVHKVIKAISKEDGQTYYFVTYGDYDDIDWGACETEEEATEWFNGTIRDLLGESLSSYYEARNPENDEVNALIKSVLDGDSKAFSRLRKMGYEVEYDDSARKEFGNKYFGNTVTITNKDTGRSLYGNNGNYYSTDNYMLARPSRDTSVTNPSQYHRNRHVLKTSGGREKVSANPNEFDYKGYLDKVIYDDSDKPTELDQFMTDRKFVKDNEYIANRVDSAKNRISNIRSRMNATNSGDSQISWYDDVTLDESKLTESSYSITAERLSSILSDALDTLYDMDPEKKIHLRPNTYGMYPPFLALSNGYTSLSDITEEDDDNEIDESNGSLYNNPDTADRLWRDSLNVYRVTNNDGVSKIVRARCKSDAEDMCGFEYDDIKSVDELNESVDNINPSKYDLSNVDIDVALSTDKKIDDHKIDTIYLNAFDGKTAYLDGYYHYGKDYEHYDHEPLSYKDIKEFSSDDAKFFDKDGVTIIDIDGLVDKYSDKIWYGKNPLKLKESVSVTNALTPAVDSFLQDIAQMTKKIDYNDINKIKSGSKTEKLATKFYRQLRNGVQEAPNKLLSDAGLSDDSMIDDEAEQLVFDYVGDQLKKSIDEEFNNLKSESRSNHQSNLSERKSHKTESIDITMSDAKKLFTKKNNPGMTDEQLKKAKEIAFSDPLGCFRIADKVYHIIDNK